MRCLQILSVYGIVATAVAATAHRDEALPRHFSRTTINTHTHIQAKVAAHSRPAPVSSSRTATAVGQEAPPPLSFFRGRRAAAKSTAEASVPAARAGPVSHEQSRALRVSGGNSEQRDEMREREEQKKVRDVLLYYPNLIGMFACSLKTEPGCDKSRTGRRTSYLSKYRAGVNLETSIFLSEQVQIKPARSLRDMLV